MKKFILIVTLLTSILFPQLKEMEVKQCENRGNIPLFINYPDKAALIFYTQFDNLKFRSSYGIVKEMGDPTGGKYIIIIEPVNQTMDISAPDL
jgi:hypothetical protein